MTDETETGPDVVVVGAGVIGLTSAIRLAEAGHRVRVLTDQPVAATTSAAAGAMLGISGAGPGDPLTTWTERSTPVFRVLGHEVGWRPVRPTPRTEVDDRGVVHAYGHVGVGVTVSWGVADEVARLVATVAG